MNKVQRFINFLKNAKKIHNNYYSYNDVVYETARINVNITCPLHGNFLQLPYNHLLGKGCPKCKIENISRKNTKLLHDDFIKIAKNLHPSLDFSKTKYINTITKILIICPKHGEKWILPKTILKGVGCRNCHVSKNRISKTEYIKKANIIHDNFYNYDLLEENTHCKSYQDIICPIHGIFNQTLDVHLQGCGCLKCGRKKQTDFQKENAVGWSYSSWIRAAKNSKNFDSYKVYIINCYNDNEFFYKIGKTFLKINRRFSNKKDLGYNYSIYKIYNFDCGIKASKYEEMLKKYNKENKYIPLLKFKGMQECFLKIKDEINIENEQ